MFWQGEQHSYLCALARLWLDHPVLGEEHCLLIKIANLSLMCCLTKKLPKNAMFS